MNEGRPTGQDAGTLSADSGVVESDVIRELEESVRRGSNWYIAMLRTIGVWTKAEEMHAGRAYRYLVAGEAFDWMLLAERLCDAIGPLVPETQRNALLFRNEPPVSLDGAQFRDLIGSSKYHQYLNYYYGVTVEEALVLAVEDEARKEKRASGLSKEHELTNEAYRRIYGQTQAVLLREFRREKGYPETKAISLSESKEFTYWRFKYRLKWCEKAKVASDTRKGLNWLKTHGVRDYLPDLAAPSNGDDTDASAGEPSLKS